MRLLATGDLETTKDIYTSAYTLKLNGSTGYYTVSGQKNLRFRVVVYNVDASNGATITIRVYGDLADNTYYYPNLTESITVLGANYDLPHYVVTDAHPFQDGTKITVTVSASTSGSTAAAVRAWVLDTADDLALSATGLDRITATTPTALATTFTDKLLQLWARFFGKTVKNASTLITYSGATTTTITTQTISDDGSTETQGAAS